MLSGAWHGGTRLIRWQFAVANEPSKSVQKQGGARYNIPANIVCQWLMMKRVCTLQSVYQSRARLSGIRGYTQLPGGSTLTCCVQGGAVGCSSSTRLACVAWRAAGACVRYGNRQADTHAPIICRARLHRGGISGKVVAVESVAEGSAPRWLTCLRRHAAGCRLREQARGCNDLPARCR